MQTSSHALGIAATVKSREPTTCIVSLSDEGLRLAQKAVSDRVNELKEASCRLHQIRQVSENGRIAYLKELVRRDMQGRKLSLLPFGHIAAFLEDRDLNNFCAAATCARSLASHGKKVMLAHCRGPRQGVTQEEADAIVATLHLPSIHSLDLDARCPGHLAFLTALIKAGPLPGLRRLTLSCAADDAADYHFADAVMRLCSSLKTSQLKSLRVSGLRSLRELSALYLPHVLTLEEMHADYFVPGHENQLHILPAMPRMRSFVLDVADSVSVPANKVASWLGSLDGGGCRVERLYLPHIEVRGTAEQLLSVVRILPRLTSAKQLVLRFERLPLEVWQVVGLRKELQRLPAVCISRQFVVAMDSWAPWWPKMRDIWPLGPSEVTAVSVFREQVDLDSMGASASREWDRLSERDRAFWEESVAARIRAMMPVADSEDTADRNSRRSVRA